MSALPTAVSLAPGSVAGTERCSLHSGWMRWLAGEFSNWWRFPAVPPRDMFSGTDRVDGNPGWDWLGREWVTLVEVRILSLVGPAFVTPLAQGGGSPPSPSPSPTRGQDGFLQPGLDGCWLLVEQSRG